MPRPAALDELRAELDNDVTSVLALPPLAEAETLELAAELAGAPPGPGLRALVSYGSARVAVADGELRAGRAHIELHHLGEAVALDADQTRRAAGVDADARAFLVLRPYLKRAVRVTITDPADPTPYWLVGTRHPERLAEALSRVTRL